MKGTKTVMGVDESIDDRMLDMVDKLLGEEEDINKNRGLAGKNTPMIMLNNIPFENSSLRNPSSTNKYHMNCNSLNNHKYFSQMKNDIPRKGSFETNESSFKKMKLQQSNILNQGSFNWGEKLNSGKNLSPTPPQIYVTPPGNGLYSNYQNFNPMQNKCLQISNSQLISNQNSPTFTRSSTLCTQNFLTPNNSHLTTRSQGFSDRSVSPRSVNSDNAQKHHYKKNNDEFSGKQIKQLYYNTFSMIKLLFI